MTRKTATIVNKLGMHARPAAQLVSEAVRFEADIFLIKEGLRVNAKSIMGVMMLAAEKGSEVTIEAEGADEEMAVAAVDRIIESGFGEEI